MNIISYIICIFATLVQKVGLAKGHAVAIVLNPTEKLALAALTHKHGVSQAIAEQVRIVLAAASGLCNKVIAERCSAFAHIPSASSRHSSWGSDLALFGRA